MRVDRFGYKVEITDEAKRTLTVIGYQRKYGVRTLLECIEEFLSGLIVDGKLYSGERVIVEPDGEKEVILRGAYHKFVPVSDGFRIPAEAIIGKNNTLFALGDSTVPFCKKRESKSYVSVTPLSV